MSNRITAYFRGRVGVTEALYQNDYGIVMNFDDIDLPAHFDCYFSTPGQDEAVPAIGADNMVQIPNAILARSGRAELHIPLHTGANDSEVEYIVHFKVIGRARPVDDGTPVQMTAIEQALALLQNPIGNIEQIVNEALAFTGDTFQEMQAQLDADQAAFKADIESDFDNLNAQYQTAVAALTVDSEVQNIRVGADNVTYASAGEAVRTQFTDLKNDVINSNNKGENFGLYAPFVNGGLSNGVIATSYRYRVSTDTIMSFDRPIVLNIKSGFRCGIHTFVDGSFVNDSGWITGTYAIEANREFKVAIARVTENTSEIANISEFVNALTFNTNTDNLIKDARGNVTLALLNVDTEWGSLTNGNNDDDSYNYNRRIRTVGYIPVEAGDVISNSTNGIKYGVHLFDYNKRFISDSGWNTGEYTIPQGGYVRIVFVRTDDDLLTKPSIQYWVATYKNGIKLQSSVSKHLEAMNARVNELDSSLSKSFYYDGEKIDVNKYGYELSQLWNFSSPTTAGTFVKEASAYYGGVVFKCYNADLIQLYNFADGTKIAEFPITCGHGDSIDFSNEYYASGDEFPLAYITADTNPATVYVNRITRSGATLVRTLTFPLERTGYYAGHCVDPINNVLYQIGYKNNDYQNPDNGNHMIVTKWDLSELTDNGNNTFTPAFLDTFDLPFMDTAQGQVMLNGKVFIMSSNPYVPADGRRTRVYVVDVGGQRISNILSEFWERIREHEGESVFFVPNGHNAYDLIVDIQATGLYKIAL